MTHLAMSPPGKLQPVGTLLAPTVLCWNSIYQYDGVRCQRRERDESICGVWKIVPHGCQQKRHPFGVGCVPDANSRPARSGRIRIVRNPADSGLIPKPLHVARKRAHSPKRGLG